MNVFQLFTEHVRSAVTTLAKAGVFPAPPDLSRIVVEPPREASHGDLATNAAMALAKDAGLKPRDLAEKIAAELAQAARGDQDRDRGAGLHQSDARSGGVARGAGRHRPRRRGLRPRQHRRRQAGERRIRLGQSDRADARRPLPRRGVRRCARQSAGGRRLRGDARVLHQRRRRAGRCAGALGVPALPRGARRKHRRDPGGALSRRLSQAGRRGAREGIRRQAQGHAGEPSGCRWCAPRRSP